MKPWYRHKTGANVLRLIPVEGIPSKLERAILSPDGAQLAASVWEDPVIRVWNLVTKELFTLEGLDKGMALAAPDAKD